MKKTRRLTATVLAMTMIFNILSTPAYAADPLPQPTQSSETVDVEGGQQTTEKEITVDTDRATGTTTVTESETVTTTTVTEPPSAVQEQTEVESKETVTTITTPAPTVQPDGAQVSGGTTTVEETEATQVTTHTETDTGTGTEIVDTDSGSSQTVTTTEETVISATPYETEVPVADVPQPTPVTSTAPEVITTPEPAWVEGTPQPVTDFTPAPTATGTQYELVTQGPETTVDFTPELKEGETVTIQLTPAGNGEFTGTTKVEITADDILAGKYPDIFKPEDIPAGYSNPVVTEKFEEINGVQVHVGWTVTYTKETPAATPKVTVTTTTAPDPLPTAAPGGTPQELPEWEQKVKDYEADKANGTLTPDADGFVTEYAKTVDSTTGEIKYTETKVKVEATTAPDTTDISGDDVNYPSAEQTPAPVETYNMPQAPVAAADADNGDGTVTIQTVEEIYASTPEQLALVGAGQLVGYRVITAVVDKNDNTKVHSMTSRDVYGTKSITTTTTTFDPQTLETKTTTTTTTTKTKEISAQEVERTVNLDVTKVETYETEVETITKDYEIIATEKGLYMYYQGKLYAIQEMTGHGTTTNRDTANSTNIKSDYGIDQDIQSQAWANANGGVYDPDTGNGAHWATNQNKTALPTSSTDGTFKVVGYGLVSAYTVHSNDTRNGTNPNHDTMQYRIVERDANGNEIIRNVYCAEMGQSVLYGNNYSVDVFDGVNDPANGNNTLVNTNTAQIRSVALNGFWGTENGVGSLAEVQNFLAASGYANASTLTAGQALTATQVAIWEFAAGFDNPYNDTGFIYGDNSNSTYNVLNDETYQASTDAQNIYALRKRLVAQAASDRAANGTTRTGAAQALGQDNIRGGAIIVKEKLSDTTYKADVEIVVDASKSSVNGSLRAQIVSNGKTITANLAAMKPTVRADGKLVYTISGVEMVDGVDADITVSGTQHIDDGIYVYYNANSQDFVGLSSKDHIVNIRMKMLLNVDPALRKTSSSKVETRDDTVTSTGTTTRTDTAVVTKTVENSSVKQEFAAEQVIHGVKTTVEKVKKVTMEGERWENISTRFIPTPTPTPVVTPTPTPTPDTPPTPRTIPTPTPTPDTTPTPVPSTTPGTTPEVTPTPETTPEVTPTPVPTTTPGPKHPRQGRRYIPEDNDIPTPDSVIIINEEPVPLGDGTGGGDTTTILDEDVPLAAVPDTGNVTVIILMAMSISSFSGARALTIRKKEEQE